MRDPPDYGRQQLRSPGASSARQAPARRASPSCDILHIRYGLRRPDHRIMKDAERRLGERLSTQRYASLATWQSRLRAQRMVGRPEYLYIAVARDGRPHLPQIGAMFRHRGGPGCGARRLGRLRARRRDRDRIQSRHRWHQPVVRRHVAGQVCLQLRTSRRAPQPGAAIRELAGRAGLKGARLARDDSSPA